MTVTINGTTGIAGTNGSAGTPAVQGEDTNTGMFFPAADTVAVTTGGSERMRVDASGNLGLGTTSPNEKVTIASSGSASYVQICDSSTGTTSGDGLFLGSFNGAAELKTKENNILAFGTNNAERARIDASGNLLVGTTTSAQTLSTNNVLTLKAPGITTVWGVGPTSSFGSFYVSTGGTGVSLASGSTSWGTVSDERQKDIIEPIADAVAKVLSLRSVIGKYKTDADGTRRSFLIAQDVQAALPEAIDVGEDEANTLSVKYTEIIPLLVAAIKEQQALITAITARVAELENK